MAAPIGLVAAAGRFPVIFAERARAAGHTVVCCGIKNLAPPELRPLVHEYHAFGIGRFNTAFKAFRRAGVREVVMAGKIHKAALLTPWLAWQLLPDWTTFQFWYTRKRRDNADDTILLGIIDLFEQRGLKFASALDFCPEILVRPGVLTRRPPTDGELADVSFGWEIAKEMGRLDVGQSVAVRSKAIIAIEAIEGTDRAIARAGELCKHKDFVVVKVAKPRQDMRFDVPTVGQSTIETMKAAGARVLAVEAGKTILLDEAATVALADRYGMTIVALNGAQAA